MPYDKLTELQKRVVEFRDESGLGFRAIGERLGGRNQGTVYNAYMAGKKKLARDLTTPRQRVEAQLEAFREQRAGKTITDQSLLDDIEATLSTILFLLRNDEGALLKTDLRVR